jgi:peptidoglycan/xylan/chitin deacetylase (PgdA/CDA1 family)
VVSIDVELRWGLRDLVPVDGGSYRQHLLGARLALPRLLDVLESYGVRATWAVVGFLMAGSREELLAHAPPPDLRPVYSDARLDPYGDAMHVIGRDEAADPLHFGASLVEQIRARPAQEIASHTFSHYYCLEPGQKRAAFAADLAAARAIAAARGLRLSSIVLPRGQLSPAYAPLMRDAGFSALRGQQGGWLYRPATDSAYRAPLRRAARLVDAYTGATGPHLLEWERMRDHGAPCDVPASMFLRPYRHGLRHLDGLRLLHIRRALRAAAASGRLFHLWWHLHNVGRDTDQNIGFLRAVLDTFAECRERHGMQSLPMREVASLAA